MTDRQTIQLPDGRTLSYLELGDPAGVPVLFTIGSPSSAIGGLGFGPAAERNGVKLISVSKPGYGLSTRDPNRSLLRYGADLVQLADALDLGRVALIGQSGGGPHAIAAACVLGDRVSTLSLLSSYGPVFEPWAREGLNPFMGTTNWFARNAPALMGLPIAGMKLMAGNPERVERMVKRMEQKMSAADRKAMLAPESTFVTQGLADAFASGNAAVSDEFRAIGQAWGFRLEDVTAPTDMWHGIEDKSCHIGMARGMATRLPHATLHELEGLSHGFFGKELDQAFSVLHLKAQ